MKQLFGLNDLLKEQMRDRYDAEMCYGNMLAKLIRPATSLTLEHPLKVVSAQSQKNPVHHSHMYNLLCVPPTGGTCQAIHLLFREAKDTAAKRAA